MTQILISKKFEKKNCLRKFCFSLDPDPDPDWAKMLDPYWINPDLQPWYFVIHYCCDGSATHVNHEMARFQQADAQIYTSLHGKRYGFRENFRLAKFCRNFFSHISNSTWVLYSTVHVNFEITCHSSANPDWSCQLFSMQHVQ
jgi:hypothetical protein